MSKFAKMTAVALGLVMVTSASLTTGVASAAPVAPKHVRFDLKNQTPGICPANVRLRAKVYSKSAGHVQVRFERADGWISAPVWVPVLAQPNGLYMAKIENIMPAVPGPMKVKARIIVFGDGQTKTSGWDTLEIKC